MANTTAVVKEEPAGPQINKLSSPDAASERASVAPASAAPEEKPTDSKSVPPKASPAAPPPVAPCQRTINSDVVALPQPIMLNRMGAAIPDALIFTLGSESKNITNSLQLN